MAHSLGGRAEPAQAPVAPGLAVALAQLREDFIREEEADVRLAQVEAAAQEQGLVVALRGRQPRLLLGRDEERLAGPSRLQALKSPTRGREEPL